MINLPACQNNNCHFNFPSLITDQNNKNIILLVKDEMLLMMHKMLFKCYGYRVKVISKPDKLCDYLMNHRPALVVIDMEIRHNLCQKIADFLKTEKIPTLLIITSGQECDVCKYLEPGLCDYVDMIEEELKLIISKAERLMGREGEKQVIYND